MSNVKKGLGRVYCIKSPQTENVYIGSTFEKYLSIRLSKHKYDYKRHLNGKYNYVSSFDIIKYGDAYVELIEKYEDIQKDELQR
jgi:hypothetical protein